MAGFTFRGGAENGCDIVEAFHVGLGRKIQVAAVCLRFARKCCFQVLFGLASPSVAWSISSVDSMQTPGSELPVGVVKP